MIAEVIIDIAHSDVDKIFDYRCEDPVCAGMCVTVPFGAPGRTATGFVIRTKQTSSVAPEKLKAILRAEEDFPALNEECLMLAEKLVQRYRCPRALVLRLFLPAEMRKGKVRAASRTFASLTKEPFSLSERAVRQREIVEFLEDNREAEASFLQKRFGSALNTLVKNKIVLLEKRRVLREPYRGIAGQGEKHILTPAQENALRQIEQTKKTVVLLHGVTGSGKTEIYLNLIAKELSAGRTAIFLVPEISLTPQMLAQLRSRFGSMAAILHSGLSAGERYDEWRRLREGEARIAIGARSAIFAPIENIGVIVMDEEHDGSYLSESAPRYHAFDIARLRAQYNHCKLILGSATPLIETYRRAEDGEFELAKLSQRVNSKPLPNIQIVDMRKEVRRGNPSPFSALLREKLTLCLKEGNQAILFLNRRGYSQSVLCRECGYVAKCEHCDVSLTYHREDDCLKCHYCGAKYRMPRACPACGGVHIEYVGTGTQRVAGELKKLFPKARILRMDNDTTSGKEGHYQILKQFANKEADFLVGTQMVAKGHDFPSVTLVGILDADMGLHFPDYRSGERTFQLVTQVAGRSGRGEEKGEVILQTFDPENAILRYAVNYDYEGFYRFEISMREGTAFPPFAKIVRVMVVGEEEKQTIETLKEVYTKLEKIYLRAPEKFLFFCKMHSPVKRIQNKYRYQVLMRLTDGALLREIYEICSALRASNALVYIEENPSNLN